MSPKKKTTSKEKKTSKKSSESIQPELNIGLVGHVDHGKTTLVRALSGKWTDTHSEELRRGITIRLGYADVSVYACGKCKGTEKYGTKEICEHCKKETVLVRKISLVDAPGHESLMATMLSGAAIMDGAILLIAANERCPQPQTREHLMALDIIGIKNVIIVQNKVDIVTEEQATRNYQQIQEFIKNSSFKNAPIIPLSAQHNVNVDALLEQMETIFPTPKQDPKATPLLYVARSFDINKPGSDISSLKGGVLGGSLKQGTLALGDEIEIRPGRSVEEQNQKVYKPIRTTVVSFIAGGQATDSIHPGGSVGVSTMLDPAVVKSDQLAGSIIGFPGNLPETRSQLLLDVHLLERVVGTDQDLEVDPIKLNEILMLNVNSTATVGVVGKLSKEGVQCNLKLPVCAEPGSRVTISRRIGDRFRLIGYGLLQ